MQRAGLPKLSRALALFAALFMAAFAALPATAHHILGRPSYSLNEDSNTPSSLQGEVLLGDYSINYSVYPAFPRPNVPGRVHVHVAKTADGTPFDGVVEFFVREDGLLNYVGLGEDFEKMGSQRMDDGVYRQPYSFLKNGKYTISVRFEAGGQPYIIDFPLRVGPPPVVGPIGVTVAVIVALLLFVSLVQRRRAMTGKVRAAHEQPAGKN